jgi:hypothetical protein
LGLDVIAFDSNYNKLDPFETTTNNLYEELKKNSDLKNQSLQSHIINQTSAANTSIREESINDANLVNQKNYSRLPLK